MSFLDGSMLKSLESMHFDVCKDSFIKSEYSKLIEYCEQRISKSSLTGILMKIPRHSEVFDEFEKLKNSPNHYFCFYLLFHYSIGEMYNDKSDLQIMSVMFSQGDGSYSERLKDDVNKATKGLSDEERTKLFKRDSRTIVQRLMYLDHKLDRLSKEEVRILRFFLDTQFC